MALSDYEKQVLAEMEQHLRQQDPDLADAMASTLPKEEAPVTPAPSKPLSPRRIALGSILAALGLGSILAGVTIGVLVWAVILGALGFLLMVGGVLLALSPDPKAQPVEGKSKNRATKAERDALRKERWNNRGR